MTDQEKLQEIFKLVKPLKCEHPEECWMNKDWGTDDIYGCEPEELEDVGSCPSKLATCILKIIEEN